MSSSNNRQDRAKFEAILKLSRDQFTAIQSRDFNSLQKILAAKGQLISTLSDTRRVIEEDPSVSVMIEQIRASEKQAGNLLRHRLDSVKQQLTDLHQIKAARREYRKVNRKTPSFAPDPNTPMLFDLRS